MYQMEPTEPKICKGCEIDPCTGDPCACMQDYIDSKADYEYERKRDERE